jgi:ubiquinone/menaquinone biosynthesis C-methylase UbiE
LQELEIKSGDRVLEVSVGTGANWRILPHTASYFGLDISRGMLNVCRKHIKKWKLEAYLFQGEAEHLPFKDAIFDVVYHVGGINFFNNKAAAIREMIRVSKPGTKLLIVDETERVARKYEKTPFAGVFYSRRPETIATPVDLVPPSMLEIKSREVANEDLYCLTFRKP